MSQITQVAQIAGGTLALPVPISKGGTDATSFTAGVVESNGTKLSAFEGTNGQILIGGGTTPLWKNIAVSNAGVTVTSGSNTIDIKLSNFVAKTLWTPVLEFGGGSVGITYAVQSGWYVRVLGVVFFSCSIALTSKGSSTGGVGVTGLPFQPTFTQPSMSYVDGVSFASGFVITRSSTTTIVIARSISGTTIVNLLDTDFTNTSIVQITSSYII